MFQVRLVAEASKGAVSIYAAGQTTRLVAPLPAKPPKKAGEEADGEDNGDAAEEEEDDDGEEAAVAAEISSDAESSHVSCDSRVEGHCHPGSDKPAGSGAGPDRTFTSSSSSSSSGSELKPKKLAVGGPVEPALGGVVRKKGKAKLSKWWDSTYYYIEDNRHTAHQDCKMVLKSEFCNKSCFGRTDMSKTRTPLHFDESHKDPVRTHLLLRAWAWQRCSSSPFIQSEEYRQRDLLTEGARLEADVASLRAEDKLLGNADASYQFAEWVPQMAARLRAA